MTELTKNYIEAKNVLEELARRAMKYDECTGDYEYLYDCELDEMKKPILDFMYSCVSRIEELEEQLKMK